MTAAPSRRARSAVPCRALLIAGRAGAGAGVPRSVGAAERAQCPAQGSVAGGRGRRHRRYRAAGSPGARTLLPRPAPARCHSLHRHAPKFAVQHALRRWTSGAAALKGACADADCCVAGRALPVLRDAAAAAARGHAAAVAAAADGPLECQAPRRSALPPLPSRPAVPRLECQCGRRSALPPLPSRPAVPRLECQSGRSCISSMQPHH